MTFAYFRKVSFRVMHDMSGVVTTGPSAAEQEQPKAPEHQVVAIYFHRAERCPTCKRIGANAEEVLTRGFEKEVRTHATECQSIDFQDKKNAKLAKGYGVETPTLILGNVFEGGTVCWTSMPKVWQLVGKPSELRTYVHQGVVRYLTQSKDDAEKELDTLKESKE